MTEESSFLFLTMRTFEFVSSLTEKKLFTNIIVGTTVILGRSKVIIQFVLFHKAKHCRDSPASVKGLCTGTPIQCRAY